MSEELKPCPFCGGEAEYEGLYCYCLQCESRMADNPDEASAIAAWNRRAGGGGEGERKEALDLAARIVEEYTMYDFGMSPANELKLARALLSSPRVERERALEEAAKVAETSESDAGDFCNDAVKEHATFIAFAIRALSPPAKDTK